MTENQANKSKKLMEYYKQTYDPIYTEINYCRLEIILRNNHWNITDSISDLDNYYNKIKEAKKNYNNLIQKANNNISVVDPRLHEGHDESYEDYYQCSNCGSSIVKHHKYCHECGIKLDWSSIDELDTAISNTKKSNSKLNSDIDEYHMIYEVSKIEEE